MNRSLITFFFIPFLLFILFVNQAKAETLAIGWEVWYPFQYRNQQQELVGLDLDIVKAILKEAKFDAAYTELPWQRNLNYVKSGEIDVAMGASITEERRAYSYFSEDYRKEKIVLVVRKGTKKQIQLTSLSSLQSSKYLIGVETGYYYGERYQALIKNQAFKQHIVEVLDIEQNIKMLIKGRIDGLLADPVTIAAFIEKYHIEDEIEIHPLPIYETSIHLMLSHKSFSIQQLERINAAIVKLKKAGRLDDIFKKYAID